MAKLSAADLEELNRRVDEMIALAKADYDAWKDIYSDGRNYIWNNQLCHVTPKQGWPRVTANYLFPAIMQELAVISGRRPKLVTKPHEVGDEAAARPWGGMLQWQFSKGLDMPHLLQKCAMDGKEAGHYASKVYWEPKDSYEPKERKWKGRVRADMIHHRNLMVDPFAENWLEADYIGIKRRIRVDYAVSRWPKYKDEIEKAAVEEAAGDDSNSKDGIYVSESLSPTTLDGDAVKGEAGRRGGGAIEGRLAGNIETPGLSQRAANQSVEFRTEVATDKPIYVTIVELWFRDPTEEDITEEYEMGVDEMLAGGQGMESQMMTAMGQSATIYTAPDGSELRQGENWPMGKNTYTVPKYPYGRFIQRVGEDTILNADERDQVWPLKYWPIVIGQNCELPHTWHGLNGVEMGRGLQDWINIALMHMAMYVMYFGDPKLKIEEGVLAADPKNANAQTSISSKAGSVIKTKANKLDKIAWVDPPMMSSGLPVFYQQVTKEIQEQTGVHDVARGQASSKRQTGYEVSRLEENTQLRVALQAALLDRFTIQVMERVVELIQQNMQPGDMVRIVGEGGREGMMPLSEAIIDAKFDIDMEVGRALPHDEEREQMKATELFKLFGLPVAEQVLDAFDVKDKKVVLVKLGVNQVMEQIAMAAQKGPDGIPEIHALIGQFAEQAVAEAQSAQGGEQGQSQPQEQPMETENA